MLEIATDPLSGMHSGSELICKVEWKIMEYVKLHVHVHAELVSFFCRNK